MGHIVIPAPGIDRFHLLERLARELRSRGHRVTVLCLDRVAFTFWSAQGLAAVLAPPGAPMPTRAPLAEFAATDCRRRRRRESGRFHAGVQRRLAALLPAVLRFFESDTPDLVCLHQQRSSAHRLVQFVARECGTRVLWTGRGLLPHTMQLDEEGIDGDARTSRRSAWDFRGLDSDESFLAAALAAALGRNAPPALSRRLLQVPPLRSRLRDAVLGLLRRHDYGFLGALDAWHASAAPAACPPPGRIDLPTRPFLVVLLQRDDDDRLLLDATAPPSPIALTCAARAVARRLDRDMPVVAVLPAGGLLARELAPLRALSGVQLETAAAAIDASAAAVAVVTVNDPSAAAALLAGTPVVHLGAALYGVPGVAIRGRTDSLGADLDRALADDQPELRKRCLSWLFTHGHVWCSVEQPDHNGISGFVLEIERRLAQRSAVGGSLQYRAGPAWPLAAEGRA